MSQRRMSKLSEDFMLKEQTPIGKLSSDLLKHGIDSFSDIMRKFTSFTNSDDL